MNRSSLLVGMSVLVILMGCGGNSPSPSAVAYDGEIYYSNGTQEELLLFASSSGMINGDISINDNPTWSLAGNEQASGQFTMNATVPGGPNRVYTGTLSHASGDLQGSGNMTQNSVTVSFSFNLPPLPIVSVSTSSATGG
jgi:hypothetical protein